MKINELIMGPIFLTQIGSDSDQSDPTQLIVFFKINGDLVLIKLKYIY
jgi:hypothetical protein